MRFFVPGFLFLLLVACGGSSQQPPPPASLPPEEPQTVEQVAVMPVDTRESALRELTESADPVEKRRALASLALFLKDEDRLDDAEAALALAAEANPLIRPYLLLELAEVRRDRGDLAGAAVALRSVVDAGGTAGSLARIRLAGVLAAAKDADPARTELRAVAQFALDELNDEEFARLARDLEGAGMTAEADSVRFRVLTQYPRTRWAEEHYGALAARASSPLATISFDEGVKLADRLGRANRYDQSLDLLSRLAGRFPERVRSADYRYTRATSLFNSRNYRQMTEVPRVPGEPYHLAIELLRARAYWRSDRPKEFVDALNALIKSAPRSSEAGAARIQLAKYYQTDEKDLDRSARLLEEGMAIVGPGSEGAHLWTLAWTHTQAGKTAQALAAFDRYLARYPDADYTTNALFWSAKLHERAGNPARRDELFRRLIDTYPYAYYSFRAREILGLPMRAPDEVASGFAFPQEALATPADPRLELPIELRAVGLDVDAARELKRIGAGTNGDPIFAWRLADFYADGGEPLRAIGILNREFRNLIRHGGTGIPKRFWQILYPRFRWDEIEKAAAASRVDPWLMAAIIRQESGWDPMTVSSAGAVGLMQIMPAEASSIGAAAGLEGIQRKDLFDPSINIRVGAAEIRQKLDAMNGNQTLAIASYNAGETAVRGWLARTPVSELDLFIDSIPYAETRLYVMIVTRNLHEYQRVYGDS